MQSRAGRAVVERHGRDHHVGRDHVMAGRKHPVQPDRVGAGSLHPEAGVAAPVRQDLEPLARDDEADGPWRPLPLLQHRRADEVGGHRRPGTEAEGPVDDIAAIHRLDRPGRRGPLAHAHVAVLTEHLGLGRLGPVGGDQETVGAGQGVAPARRRMPVRQLHDHPDEGRIVELVTAKQPGLQDPVKAGLEKRLVDLVGIMAPPVGLGLLLMEQRTQRHRPGDQGVGRQPRLRLRQGPTWAGAGGKPRRNHAIRHSPPRPLRHTGGPRRGAQGRRRACAPADSAHM